ncbi:HAMP domain-containing histidine kinase [Candidatus Pacearchaeota archaeon]|nr:HAMP domain-containing histidine kinase [Candidatus Pacearchaeota archaeon]
MVQIPNTLTSDEKLSVARIIDHDSTSPLINLSELVLRELHPEIFNLKSDFKSMQHYINHTLYMFDCLDSLITQENLIDNSNIVRLLDISETLSGLIKELSIEYEEDCKRFPGRLSLLYPFLYTLSKNSKHYNAKKIQLKIKKERPPKNLIYAPNSSRDFTEFVAFHLNDNGRGFVPDFDYQKALTTCPELGKKGFGLYFTGLIAKVLGARIDIHSKRGDTTVSFYHPVY